MNGSPHLKNEGDNDRSPRIIVCEYATAPDPSKWLEWKNFGMVELQDGRSPDLWVTIQEVKSRKSHQNHLWLSCEKDIHLWCIKPEMWGLFYCSIVEPNLTNIIIIGSVTQITGKPVIWSHFAKMWLRMVCSEAHRRWQPKQMLFLLPSIDFWDFSVVCGNGNVWNWDRSYSPQ